MNERKLWGIVLAAGEGTRVRDFLAQLCGGQGIKQFCAVVGRRSMLEHTLARIERLIPRERILIVVSPRHRQEVEQQLAHWPTNNITYQPANRDTAPGILLPLAHVSHRDPFATAASLWVTAALGLAVGVGMVLMAFATAILVFLLLRFGPRPGLKASPDEEE